MCPALSPRLLKMQKPVAMSLKQFMLRSEILKLYRGFMRLGKLLNEPPAASQNPSNLTGCNGNPMREEWKEWVRSEFRLRQHSSTDDEATRTLLVHGKRQLQEMERTILLATNRNTSSPVTPPPASPHHQCPSKNKTNHKPSDTLLSSQNGTTESSNSSTSQNIKRKQDSNL